jgi:DNA-binding transcriptional LysR family regulator
VVLGLGISIVTDICLSGKEPVARIPLDRYFPNRSYGVVLRRGKFLSPQAKRFIDMMAPQFFRQDEKNAKMEPTTRAARNDPRT